MRLFVSHSSTDKLAFRQVAEALGRAGIKVWDYLEPAHVNLGVVLDEDLRLQICSCEVVIVLISDAALANPLVRHEVEVALHEGYEAGRLLAIVLPGTRLRATWEGPFRMLADRVYEQVIDENSLELAISRVLGALRIAYVSGIASHPRMPVRERTLRELSKQPVQTQQRLSLQPQALYNALVLEIDRGSQFYCQQDYERAAISYERAAVNLQAMLAGLRPYYLAIAQVVCDVHLGRHASANARLDQLGVHPELDESWHAARGIVCLALGQQDAALGHFRGALQECRRRGTSELEVLAQLSQIDTSTEWALSLEGAQVSPHEMTTLRYIRAKRRLDRGDHGGAVAEMMNVPQELLDEDGMLLLSEALYGIGRLDESIAVLARPAATVRTGDRRLRMLARRFVSAGMLRRAAESYRHMLGDRPAGREGIWIECARVLRLIGQNDEARALCEQIVSTAVGIPGSGEVAYCVGFAYFMLDRHEVARVFVAMAAGYPARGYADVLNGDREYATYRASQERAGAPARRS